MGTIKTGDEFIDDSEGILKRTRWKLKYPEYASFDKDANGYHKNLKEEGLEFDVSSEIGNEGSREIYKGKGIEMRWSYTKRSGEHKKNNGCIKIYGNSLSAYFDIEKGRAISFTFTNPRFASEIKERKEMPLYKEITSLFSK